MTAKQAAIADIRKEIGTGKMYTKLYIGHDRLFRSKLPKGRRKLK